MNEPSSDALRMRRVRRHAKGDHAMCVPGKCAVLLEEAAPVEPPEPGGGIALMVRTFTDSLRFAEGDPRRLMAEVAVKLARYLDREQSVVPAARELRVIVAQLAEVPNEFCVN